MSKFKVGDKARITCSYVWEPEHGREAVITKAPGDDTCLTQRLGDDFGWWYAEHDLELIEDEPVKFWQDLSDEEKGALLLAHHKKQRIEYNVYGELWLETEYPGWIDQLAYRVKPEPVVETTSIYIRQVAEAWLPFRDGIIGDSHKITFEVVDGEADVTSIKMEKL